MDLVAEMEEGREEHREYRKESTSMGLDESTGTYVFDEAAVAASNDETHRRIEEITSQGHGVVATDEYLTSLHHKMYEMVLEDLSKLIPGLKADDVISSLCAYLAACSDDLFECPYRVFVTGNIKMLKLIEEESSREEIHQFITSSTGVHGVHYYMFIDNEGSLKRANLKWDDCTRPSDQRVLCALGLPQGNSSL